MMYRSARRVVAMAWLACVWTMAGSAQAQERLMLEDIEDWRQFDWRVRTMGLDRPEVLALEGALGAAYVPQSRLRDAGVLEAGAAVAYGAAFSRYNAFFLDADLRLPLVYAGASASQVQAFPLTEGRLRAQGKLGGGEADEVAAGLRGFVELQGSGTYLRGRRRHEVGPAPFLELHIGAQGFVALDSWEFLLGWSTRTLRYLEASPIEGTTAHTLTIESGMGRVDDNQSFSLGFAGLDLTRITGTMRQGSWSSPVWQPARAPESQVDPDLTLLNMRLMHIRLELAQFWLDSRHGEPETYGAWLRSEDALLVQVEGYFGLNLMGDNSRDGAGDVPGGFQVALSMTKPSLGRIALSTHFGLPSYSPDGQVLLARWRNELDLRWSPRESIWGASLSARYDEFSVSPLADEGPSDALFYFNTSDSNALSTSGEVHLKLGRIELAAFHLMRTFPGALQNMPRSLLFHEAGIQLRLR